METKTEPKYRVLKHIGGQHIYYREQFTNRIAVADQSCISELGKILPPTCQDDDSHGVLYIDFSKIDEWNLKSSKAPISQCLIYDLPVYCDEGTKYTVLISESEYKWLVGYF